MSLPHDTAKQLHQTKAETQWNEPAGVVERLSEAGKQL